MVMVMMMPAPPVMMMVMVMIEELSNFGAADFLLLGPSRVVCFQRGCRIGNWIEKLPIGACSGGTLGGYRGIRGSNGR